MHRYALALTALALTALATLSLSACGSETKPDQETSTVRSSAPVAETTPSGPSLASAPAAFAQCSSCHTIRPGANAVGPSLFGLFGQKAGAVEGYAYTDANRNSGLTWDEATLDTYLTAPMKMVPGTKMIFAGVADPAKRQAIIDFLKTVK